MLSIQRVDSEGADERSVLRDAEGLDPRRRVGRVHVARRSVRHARVHHLSARSCVGPSQVPSTKLDLDREETLTLPGTLRARKICVSKWTLGRMRSTASTRVEQAAVPLAGGSGSSHEPHSPHEFLSVPLARSMTCAPWAHSHGECGACSYSRGHVASRAELEGRHYNNRE